VKAPFPYFGGKSSIAAEVWRRFGDCPNYAEPFLGSAAVLLARPTEHNGGTETVNDADGLLSNFWRAVSHAPDEVAHHADWPVSECDLHARHSWLVNKREDITRRLEGDPEWYDAKAAGWWVWGCCQWIGSGWCAAEGPWRVVDGELLNVGDGVKRKLPHLGAGRGINRKLPHLGDAGRGINRQLPHLGNAGMGMNSVNQDAPRAPGGTCADWSEHLRGIMGALSDRLRRVRICCGDWSRVCGPTPTVYMGLTGVFLDPPYAVDDRSDCYVVESREVAHVVREWAIAHGDDPRLRIALCGYDTEHGERMPDTWTAWAWKANGGYGLQGDSRGRANAAREVVWFSPHCLGQHVQPSLFDEVSS